MSDRCESCCWRFETILVCSPALKRFSGFSDFLALGDRLKSSAPKERRKNAWYETVTVDYPDLSDFRLQGHSFLTVRHRCALFFCCCSLIQCLSSGQSQSTTKTGLDFGKSPFVASGAKRIRYQTSRKRSFSCRSCVRWLCRTICRKHFTDLLVYLFHRYRSKFAIT